MNVDRQGFQETYGALAEASQRTGTAGDRER